jgi:hypothetical protein
VGAKFIILIPNRSEYKMPPKKFHPIERIPQSNSPLTEIAPIQAKINELVEAMNFHNQRVIIPPFMVSPSHQMSPDEIRLNDDLSIGPIVQGNHGSVREILNGFQVHSNDLETALLRHMVKILDTHSKNQKERIRRLLQISWDRACQKQPQDTWDLGDALIALEQ